MKGFLKKYEPKIIYSNCQFALKPYQHDTDVLISTAPTLGVFKLPQSSFEPGGSNETTSS